MSMSSNLHCAKRAEARELGTASNLMLINDDNDYVVIFMPFECAAKMADIFNQETAPLTDSGSVSGASSPLSTSPADVEEIS